MEEYAPGDIVEVKTDKGLAYLQVTHTHASYPPVVRFLTGPHKNRPENVTVLTGSAEGPLAMVPLSGVLRKLNLAHTKVGTAEIPQGERKFPTFRMPVRDKQGEIIYWWFWDGQGVDLFLRTHGTPEKAALARGDVVREIPRTIAGRCKIAL